MGSLETTCQCACGVQEFQLRIKRDEQVGLLTCAAGHHSLLLDSREYWADVLQDGKPKMSRCRCGGTLFRVALEYEFRDDGDVSNVEIRPTCVSCGREQSAVFIEIKYSPTTELVSKPLDPIEQPWLQPKRHEITSFWQPVDAEKFASYLVQSLGARVFSENSPYEFTEIDLADIEFYPELKHDLLFTNVEGVTVPRQHEPQRSSQFLHLTHPYHMVYYWPTDPNPVQNLRFLHYIRYSDEVARGTVLEKQPSTFLTFTRQAREWLSQNYVSMRGKNTADNLEEYLRVKPELARLRGPEGS